MSLSLLFLSFFSFFFSSFDTPATIEFYERTLCIASGFTVLQDGIIRETSMKRVAYGSIEPMADYKEA